jgi:hypothetical protein
MQYARPPSGFIIREVETIKQLIDGSTAEWPRLPAYWDDVKKRLSMDGHRVGEPLPRFGPGHRVFVSEGDAQAGLPTLWIGYHVLGDTISFRILSVKAPPA